MKKLIIVLLALAGVTLSPVVDGASIVLAPVADTSLFEQNPDNNLGAATNSPSGSNASLQRSRALLRFDIAGQLPTNAVIQSAALTVNVIIVPGGGGTASTFDLRRMLVGWTEGTGTGSSGQAAKTGESTWNHRAHPGTSWSAAGGAIGSEYSSMVSASVAMNAAGAYTFVSTANLVADVQQWLTVPGTNYGWAVFTELESGSQTVRRFAARENGANGPSLSINYTIPPTLQNLVVTNRQFQFGFPAAAGQAYNVQYADGLFTSGWSNLIAIAPPVAATNILVTDFATNLQRYYRVMFSY